MTSPGRGRPRAARASDVAALALRMFTRDGFDETTMDSIARAAGISRPTLFRYFASKSDIVWDRTQEEAEELEQILAATARDADPMEVLCAAIPRVLRYPDTDLDLLRTQVTIIATESSVQANAHARTEALIELIATYIADRSDRAPGDLIPQVMSRSLWSAGFTALSLWAASSEERPDRYLAEAFAALRAGFAIDTTRRPALP